MSSRVAAGLRLVCITVIVFFAVLYVFVCAALWSMQDKMIFPGWTTVLREPSGEEAATGYQVQHLVTADGLDLRFWAAQAKPGYPTLLMFHGNASSADMALPYVGLLHQVGYGVVLAEYRGYAGNPGSPSEAAFHQDALSYADWVEAHTGSLPVVYGESLGTGVSVGLAAERPVCGLIVDSAFSSIDAVQQAGPYFWVPTFLLHTHFDSLAKIAQVKAPILFLSGDADRLIPTEQTLALAAAATAPKQVVVLHGVNHLAFGNDTTGVARPAILSYLHAAQDRCGTSTQH